jgi:hypothetical protein
MVLRTVPAEAGKNTCAGSTGTHGGSAADTSRNQITSGMCRHLEALAAGLLRLVDEVVVGGRQRADRPEGVLCAREEAEAAAAD